MTKAEMIYRESQWKGESLSGEYRAGSYSHRHYSAPDLFLLIHHSQINVCEYTKHVLTDTDELYRLGSWDGHSVFYANQSRHW